MGMTAYSGTSTLVFACEYMSEIDAKNLPMYSLSHKSLSIKPCFGDTLSTPYEAGPPHPRGIYMESGDSNSYHVAWLVSGLTNKPSLYFLNHAFLF